MHVYIILSDTKSVLTRIIKVFTRYPYNHASISFTKELDVVYSFGRKRPNNPFIGGFVKEDLDSSIFKGASCAIYKCTVTENHYLEMLSRIQKIEEEKELYKYNFIGLFAVLLNKKMNREKAYFCSQFVATILSNAGIAIKDKPACLVKPNDLTDCGHFEFVYQGELKDYLLVVQGKERDEQTENSNRRFYYLSSIYSKITRTIAN
ncbi:hypothetical protein [Metabacillus malikii]|uniref:Permuted papain-like amidase enzyme, YaeF/YiiX, C92 family n=1 Tax=Metabacillus malikii TaxID=1504265 RepID=A0ABT9ZBF5_9BACI|nr:hypothetical protein [Metabacillus malikii]MDQ0229600.1 hypothetical protein [Metabacillus malikii]